MSEELGVREARDRFGRLVNAAVTRGTVTYITRGGERFAAIVPAAAAENGARLAEAYAAALDKAAAGPTGDPGVAAAWADCLRWFASRIGGEGDARAAEAARWFAERFAVDVPTVDGATRLQAIHDEALAAGDDGKARRIREQMAQIAEELHKRSAEQFAQLRQWRNDDTEGHANA